MLIIQEKKLYREVGIKSFDTYLKTRRNKISRARAYQLINFIKHKGQCGDSGTAVPANERQSRALRTKVIELDPFEQQWVGVFKYLRRKFLNLSAVERSRFAETLGVAAHFFASWAQRLQAEQTTRSDQALGSLEFD